MAVYSKQFFSDVQTNTTINEYTVPTDGATYVLRSIVVTNLSSSSLSSAVEVEFGPHLWEDPSIPANTSVDWEGRMVLTPGWVLQWSVGPGEGSVIVSGYRLT